MYTCLVGSWVILVVTVVAQTIESPIQFNQTNKYYYDFIYNHVLHVSNSTKAIVCVCVRRMTSFHLVAVVIVF